MREPSITDNLFEVEISSNIINSSDSFLDDMELFEETSINEVDSHIKESETVEFPNETYADFMTLVTNYNLNNEAANAIIRFFNKHSNLSTSPLPKNIKIGKELVEKMQSNTFGFEKHCITRFNNKDYFLVYHPIINCIQNILKIPDISENFAYKYEEMKIKLKFIIKL